jgi:hypothetical protein
MLGSGDLQIAMAVGSTADRARGAAPPRHGDLKIAATGRLPSCNEAK